MKTDDGKPRGGLSFQVLFLAVIAVYIVFLLTDAPRLSKGASLFPLLIIGLAGVFVALKVASVCSPGLRRYLEPPRQSVDPSAPTQGANSNLAVWLWCAGAVASMYLIGFLVGMAVSVFVYVRFYGRESWPAALTVSAVTLAFSYLVFARAMRIEFDLGLLGRLFSN